jgi:hypothetical protein
MLLEGKERHMSLAFPTTLLLMLALPLAACSHRTNTASRSPDDTLRDGTPPGDHTGSNPAHPSNGADDSAGGETGPQPPGPGWSEHGQDAPASPLGASAGPNGASPAGSGGPVR